MRPVDDLTRQNSRPRAGPEPAAMQCKPLSKTIKAVAGALLAAVLITSASAAQQTVRTTVIFETGVSNTEITSYVDAWESAGAETLMYVPFVNGVVLEVPDWLTVDELSVDPIVATVDLGQSQSLIDSDKDDATLELLPLFDPSLEGQLVGPSLEVQLVDPSLESVQLVDPYWQLSASDRPWGILNTFDQVYDPTQYFDWFSEKKLAVNIIKALPQVDNIRVAVFDTGINMNSAKLKDYVYGGIDLINFIPGIPLDDNGHGTHVAGSIGGQALGVAEGVQLYAVKILDSDAAGDSSTLVMALQWALDNNIDIVNMSVAFREDNPAVRLAVQQAYAAGVVMVAATGNYSNWIDDGGAGEGGAGEGGAGEGGAGEGGAGEGGAGTCTDPALNCTPDGHYPVMYPALYPEVIAVGAIDSYYTEAWFSNSGPELDVLAPGVNVISAGLGDSSLDQYGIASGTSMATPHVTGSVVLMQALAQKQGAWLSPAQVQKILKETSLDGVLDLVGALRLAQTIDGDGPVSDNGKVK